MRRAAHGGGAGNRLRRWLAAGSVLALAAITLAVFGSLSTTSKRDVQLGAGARLLAPGPKGRRADPHGGAPRKLSARGNRPPVSAAEVSLKSALTKSMRIAGPSSGALVYDLGSRSELFALRPDVKRPPASVEKLWTTTALMSKLGPNVHLHTEVLGSGSLRHGVWHGNLYLRGGGDPTFGDPTFNRDWELGYGPTGSQLVAQLVRRGIRRVTGSVFGDESLFDRRRGGLMTN
jgi:D-alanyl-D-alanine carboxypeptidase